jgi:hypothetical protein
LLDPSSSLPGSRWRAGPVREISRTNEVAGRNLCSLFDLAPGGVCLAKLVTQPAGELLPHRFTLTTQTLIKEIREAVCFLLHFPGPCDRWALPIAMSCGARTFLPLAPYLGRYDDPTAPAGDHPVHSEPQSNFSVEQAEREGGVVCFAGVLARRVRLDTCSHFYNMQARQLNDLRA